MDPDLEALVQEFVAAHRDGRLTVLQHPNRRGGSVWITFRIEPAPAVEPAPDLTTYRDASFAQLIAPPDVTTRRDAAD